MAKRNKKRKQFTHVITVKDLLNEKEITALYNLKNKL